MSIEFGSGEVPYINLGQGYQIRLEFEDITNEKYLEKAKNELRETDEVKRQALDELRDLIESEFCFDKKFTCSLPKVIVLDCFHPLKNIVNWHVAN
jgi:hypothetical protein